MIVCGAKVPFKVTHAQTKLRLTGEYVADILVETEILIAVEAVRQTFKLRLNGVFLTRIDRIHRMAAALMDRP